MVFGIQLLIQKMFFYLYYLIKKLEVICFYFMGLVVRLIDLFQSYVYLLVICYILIYEILIVLLFYKILIVYYIDDIMLVKFVKQDVDNILYVLLRYMYDRLQG